MKGKCFTFNPFQENTYIVWDESRACAIIDPGMCESAEDEELSEFIVSNELNPVLLLNTHCHIDHILGNAYCAETYGLLLHAHPLDIPLLERSASTALMYDLPYRQSPMPGVMLSEGDKLNIGKSSLDVLFVPGHAPGHVAFVDHLERCVYGGDVLFRGSVGRVDFPGCSPSDLVHSIREKMYALPEDYVVWPGHGPKTTIGEEKRTNAFVSETNQRLIL